MSIIVMLLGRDKAPSLTTTLTNPWGFPSQTSGHCLHIISTGASPAPKHPAAQTPIHSQACPPPLDWSAARHLHLRRAGTLWNLQQQQPACPALVAPSCNWMIYPTSIATCTPDVYTNMERDTAMAGCCTNTSHLFV